MCLAGRRGKVQNYVLEKQSLITTTGEPWLRTSGHKTLVLMQCWSYAHG
jgi:hypothetical protein